MRRVELTSSVVSFQDAGTAVIKVGIKGENPLFRFSKQATSKPIDWIDLPYFFSFSV